MDAKKEWISDAQKNTLLTALLPEAASTHLTSKDEEETTFAELEKIVTSFISRLNDKEKKKGPIRAMAKGNEHEIEEEEDDGGVDWRWS